MKEICICAAVKDDAGNIIRGHRHDHAMKRIIEMGNIPKEQGFMTSYNRFVDRREAAELQKAAGIKSVWTKDGEIGEVLFSEDLY
jgi:hypothetical protein